MVDSLGTPEYRKLAVGTALSYDTVSWARTILDNLDLENANDSAFYEFNDIAVSLAEDTLPWFALDSTQLSRMWELAESDFEVAIHAQAVLGLVLDTIFERTPEPLPDGPSFKAGDEDMPEEPVTPAVAASDINVFPNPFQNSFQVTYLLEKEASLLSVEVFDLMGRSVHGAEHFKVQSGTVHIDLEECLGVYILRITADGKRIHNQKVVCLQR